MMLLYANKKNGFFAKNVGCTAHSRVILDYPPLLLFEIDHGVIVGAPTKSPPLRSTINKEYAF